MEKDLLLELNRKYCGRSYTIGHLKVDGTYMCDTLEPPVRDYKGGERKIFGHSAIPAGKYMVNCFYSAKFGKQMPYLRFVPGFMGVMIHPGNTVRDTMGCILPGWNEEVGKVLHSKDAYEMLWERMKKTWDGWGHVYIEITEE